MAIYYDEQKDMEQGGIEINGVYASYKWWKELFKEIGIIPKKRTIRAKSPNSKVSRKAAKKAARRMKD